MEQLQDTSKYILSLADRCVKCGLCLPQCPTYNLAANENESPRGRIALIQGWLTGELAASETLTNHLDQCLLCRRCERVCPSQVPYGEIMDQSKALLNERSKASFSLRYFITNNSLKLLLNKNISAILFSLLRVLQNIGVVALTKKTGLLKLLGLQRLASYLPKLNKAIKTKSFYPSETTNSKGHIALFTGCLSKQLDPKTVTASIKLLNRLGYGVYVPEQQTCCGALHLHEGNMQQAAALAKTNVSTFNQQQNISAVISLVNGCTSQLREYSQLNTGNSFNIEVKDIVEFLTDITWPKDVKFNALNKPIGVQIPCSLQNSLRAEDKLLTLLKRIPNISISSTYNKCCGAAGSYFLRNPKLSDQLKEQATNQLCIPSPEIIISSNLGCALQLQSGLSGKENPPQILHPIVLFEQQLLNK